MITVGDPSALAGRVIDGWAGAAAKTADRADTCGPAGPKEADEPITAEIIWAAYLTERARASGTLGLANGGANIDGGAFGLLVLADIFVAVTDEWTGDGTGGCALARPACFAGARRACGPDPLRNTKGACLVELETKKA